MSIKHAISKYWDTVLAFAAGASGAVWFTKGTLDSVTTEVIAFFTIQAAVILPAMIFTAGLLRAQGLTLQEAERYHAALRKQMYFWVTLLLLDLLVVTFLIIGKAASWHWVVTVSTHQAELAGLLKFSAAFTGALAVLRMIPFVRGVMSLMELNGWLVRKAIQAEEAQRSSLSSRLPPTAASLDLPEGYGKILPHPRKPRRSAGS